MLNLTFVLQTANQQESSIRDTIVHHTLKGQRKLSELWFWKKWL